MPSHFFEVSHIAAYLCEHRDGIKSGELVSRVHRYYQQSGVSKKYHRTEGSIPHDISHFEGGGNHLFKAIRGDEPYATLFRNYIRAIGLEKEEKKELEMLVQAVNPRYRLLR